MAEAKAKKTTPTKPAREGQCRVEGCKRPFRAKGYCVTHYKEWRRGKLPKPRYRRCKKEGCNKPMVRRGFCEEHAGARAAAAAPAAG
jgi:hypothetical protein